MDEKIIENIKALGIDMISQAKSGHPGIVLGAAPTLYTLYSRHMHVYSKDPNWENRDRFVLSAGHGSALLYATLFMAGLDYNIDDLKSFRQIRSRTPGHPECESSPFIEASTGPLGQGIGMAVGMALSQKIECARNKTPIDYYTYVLCGDGDLMEGLSYEALSFAGSYNLDHLILLYDSNEISLDGKTANVFDENIKERFLSMQFHVEEVEDGNDVEAIDRAIIAAKRANKPSLIAVHTTIGRGSLLEGTSAVHGSPLKEEDVKQLKEQWGIGTESFYVDEEAKQAFNEQFQKRSEAKYNIFSKQENVTLDSNRTLQKEINLIVDFWNDIGLMSKESLRDSHSRVLNAVAKEVPNFIGGSADLNSSTRTFLKDFGVINKNDFTGKNIAFGVREHAMGAILNGLSLSGYSVFGSTFLAFADYMKPAIRLSALMNTPVTYIFTHDSILVGEDGPTHQPIEQLAMLRSTPRLRVFRPCDIKEVIGTWKYILEHPDGPNAIILSKEEVPTLENSFIEEVQKGAYTVYGSDLTDAVLIATGTEVPLAVKIAEELLTEKNISIRVVSMPCMELFKKQELAYQEKILSKDVLSFVLEAGSSFGWEGFVTDKSCLFTIDSFGYSGKKEDVLIALGYTKEKIKDRIVSKMKEKAQVDV